MFIEFHVFSFSTVLKRSNLQKKKKYHIIALSFKRTNILCTYTHEHKIVHSRYTGKKIQRSKSIKNTIIILRKKMCNLIGSVSVFFNNTRQTVTECLGFSRLSIGMPPEFRFVLSAVIIMPPIV